MRWPLLLLAGVSGCALHGVQPVDPRWTLPLEMAAVCVVRGDQVRIDGRWLVAATCRDGLRLFDRQTKRETDFVSWAEIRP